MKTSVYMRLEQELLSQVKEYAESGRQTISGALQDLVSRGLSSLDITDMAGRLEKELGISRDESQRLLNDKSLLESNLQVAQKNEALARMAREQAEAHKIQLERTLSVGVAICGNQSCLKTWRLYDVWLRRCPYCGSTAAKLAEHYKPAPTNGENLRDLLAVVGGAAAVVGILKAIDGSTDST